jgi:RimJ/RimL family protein N-acetyltransferase
VLFETPRLVLRRFRAEDLPRFVAYRRDPVVARFQAWEPDYSPQDAERFLDGQSSVALGDPGKWVQIAVLDRKEDALVGDCAVCALPQQPLTWELGVTFAQSAQRKGLAREALGAVVGMLVAEHEAHRVIASVDERNEGAARLAEALGFRREARLVEADWFKEEWATLLIYAMLARDWAAE